MAKFILAFSLFLFFFTSVHASFRNTSIYLFANENNSSLSIGDSNAEKNLTTISDSIQPIRHPKLTAAILTLTLGMLGAHRLYLGCKPWVPVFYLLTVGGVFFVIPIIDFIAILTTKDISKYYNNSAVLMWMKP